MRAFRALRLLSFRHEDTVPARLGRRLGKKGETIAINFVESGELVRRDNGTWLLTGEPTGLPSAGTRRVVPMRRRFIGEEPPSNALA